MIVRGCGGGAPIRLEQPNDFKSFKVVLNPVRQPVALWAEELLGIAEVASDEYVWVSEEWVRRAAGWDVSPDWQAGYVRMLEFAKKKGWIRASDGAIRAHVEWSNDPS